MTLDEIIQNQHNCEKCEYHAHCFYCVKQIALTYAREIIPEEDKRLFHGEDDGVQRGYNACRTQILSRIEEDSK